MPARRRPALPPESLSSLSPCLPPPTSWSPGAGRCLGLQWKLRGCNQHQQARGCCHHSCAAASTRSFPRPGSGQAAPRQRVLSNPCKLGSGNPKSRPIKNPKSRPIQNPNPKSRPIQIQNPGQAASEGAHCSLILVNCPPWKSWTAVGGTKRDFIIRCPDGGKKMLRLEPNLFETILRSARDVERHPSMPIPAPKSILNLRD